MREAGRADRVTESLRLRPPLAFRRYLSPPCCDLVGVRRITAAAERVSAGDAPRPASHPHRTGASYPSPAQPGPARPSPVQPSPARPGPARPGPARPGPARPSPAQPGPAQSRQPCSESLLFPGHVTAHAAHLLNSLHRIIVIICASCLALRGARRCNG